MIVVCEPQCTGASHEKVNSGFLTVLRHAYPHEPIRLHADRSHHDGLRAVLAHDGVSVDPLEHRDFKVREAYGLRGALSYYRQFRRMLRDAAEAGSHDVLFLSCNPLVIYVLKILTSEAEFRQFRFTSVLHANFEDIANATFREVATTAVAEPSLVQKLRSIELRELPAKVAGLVARKASERYASAWHGRLRTADAMTWRRGGSFAYVALSPHIVANAAEHIDLTALDIHTVEMPINFAPPGPPPANAHIKFATFGYGDPAALRKVVDRLSRLNVRAPYEIRVIGMDNRGLETCANVTCPSPGRVLSRTEMERYATDIDAFLILYDKNRYRLSCSGSIFEALSYVKPVLHIGNPCVAQFDRPDAPIGFPCGDLDAVGDLMASMINDFARYQQPLQQRRDHMMALREQLSMDNLATKLKAAFLCG